MVYLGPDSQGSTFVANKCFVVSFLCVLDMLFERNNSEFKGENIKHAITRHSLRATASALGRTTFIELAI